MRKFLARWITLLDWQLIRLASRLDEGESSRVAEVEYNKDVVADRRKQSDQ